MTLTGLLAAAQPALASPAAEVTDPVNAAFGEAAETYQVPRELLIAVGYGETRLDDHDGAPSHARGYGVMHLVDNPTHRTLVTAAGETGLPVAELRSDTVANIHGGAAVLRAYADEVGLSAEERADLDAWYPVVARYGGADADASARLYADHVYDLLRDGLAATVGDGETVVVQGQEVDPERGEYAEADLGVLSDDYPSARWVPAHTSNYSAGRTQAIDTVVIHVTQGSYAGAISWFQNPAAQVSAHYTIRSSDGEITQSVRDRDTAWHARSANSHSIGIEHEGWVDEPSWFTDAMYRSSAALTQHLAAEHGIPLDRQHIVGHVEVPGNDHTDPGPHWDWNYYMELVGGDPGEPGEPGEPGAPELTFPSYSTLANGSTGPQVSALQYLLNQNGQNAGTVDGQFGPNTESAVRGFQSAKGLAVDGKVGPRTWTALLSAGSTDSLRQGSSGAAVSRLQRALTAALGRTVSADGQFGPLTDQAVREYQDSRGLGVDGQVGPLTWGALQSGR
ncbi:peptidoglycan-binding protein [Streptomyces sp. DSM 44915]|uniref:N-acetylmuramoyl-L-alanine amidase n=1 Tax=Streptomyces chisholmiae TaxID=3075540 RepID=A0ABU2JX80_9ACTN|nr:peptidoglycan-binding protein [Streptomyces sp. DSM 44915]MDT0269610.1 peptidoglycan-binding protein [Streptomyces sp. DSM 44915]